MINQDKIAGYYAGFDAGYLHNPPRFALAERPNPFVAGYIEGFVDGGELRDTIELHLEQQYNCENREMFRIINQRKIKF